MEKKITTIKERILYYAKTQGISIEKLLESIDMTYGSFKGVAKKTSLNSDAIEKILTKYPDINPYWLLLGIDQPLITAPKREINNISDSDILNSYKEIISSIKSNLETKDKYIQKLEEEIERLKKEVEN